MTEHPPSIDEIWKIVDSLTIKEPTVSPKTNVCKNCPDEGIIIEDTSNGCYVCVLCGLTAMDTVIDSGPEINYIDSNKADPSRHGTYNPLFPNSSLSTVISGNSKLSKISQWNAMPYNERSLWQISQYIKTHCNPHSIPNDIVTLAIMLFKKIDEQKKDNGKKEIHRGKVRDGLVSACLYYAFKKNNIDRTPLEISKIMHIDIIDVTRGCKLFLDLMRDESFSIDIKTPQPTDFLHRFCNNLNIPFKITIQIKKILDEIIKLNILSRNTPIAVVAGTIYFATFQFGYDISKKEVSKICNVSDVTISKTFKKLCEVKTYLLSI